MSRIKQGTLVDVINTDGKSGLRMYVSHEASEKGNYFLSFSYEKECSETTKELNYKLNNADLMTSYKESDLRIVQNETKDSVSNNEKIALGDLVEVKDLFNEEYTLRLYVVDIKKDEEGNDTYKLSYRKDAEQKVKELEEKRKKLKEKEKSNEEFEEMLMISQLIACAQSNMIFGGAIFDGKKSGLFDPYFKRSDLVLIRD